MLNKINISSEKQKLIVYIVLILAILAVFWQVNQYDFVNLDDQIYVTENDHIQSGITWQGFRWAFGTTYAEFWHPLTWLSLMLDNQLHGLNAGGYHLTNLILHIMSTLLLFWLFNRMTGALWRSAFVAVLFALHPLHVESVAWIAERKDVLSTFFWMLTLCLYVYYTEKPVIKRYLPVLFGFACGLMSKSMVVTMPVIMILLDYWPLKRFQWKKTESNQMGVARGKNLLWLLWEKTPFFILSALFSILTIHAKYKPLVQHFSLNSRIANASVSFTVYLEKTFWPYDLAVFYPFSHQIPLWQVLGSVFLILVISTVVVAVVKSLPHLFVGWSWYAITLLPVIGIIQVGDFAMADRFHYLPSIGIAIMLSWGIPSLIRSENIRRQILFPVSIAAIAIMAVLNWEQCSYWKNSIELWNHALRVTRDNYLAHDGLALALFTEGKTDQALVHYNESVRLKPAYVTAYNNRGNVYAKLGQYQTAIEDYNKAIAMKPDYASAYYNRGVSYAEIGQYQLAIEDYDKAIAIKSDYADAYNNRGVANCAFGRFRSGVKDYSEAIRLRPNYADAFNNRGVAYAKFGQYQPAIEDFSQAINIRHDYTDAYNNRGITYFKQGSKKLCCDDLLKACKLGNCKTLQAARNSGDCR
jgi:protein O-mannosyl-transferase